MAGDQLQENVRRWLSTPDPWMNHNIARKVHHRDTAVWFIQGDVFRQWRSTGRLLWIHGLRRRIYLPSFPLLIRPYVVAGSGKTVLSCVPSQRFHLGLLTLSTSSSIIEKLHNSNMRKMGLATICFFYFDFRWRKTGCPSPPVVHSHPAL